MSKAVKLVLSVLLVSIAGMVVWRMQRSYEREPVYQGKRLSVWLRDSSGTGELTNAVRQIGTNGIPTLLTMLCKKDSPTFSRLIDLWDRYIVKVRYLPALVRYPDWYLHQAHHMNDSALSGFKILGADAKQALPGIVDIYEQHHSRFLPDNASIPLIAVGPATAIPLFLRDAGSSNKVVRLNAVMALCHVDSEPELVVPQLAKLLSDSDINIRFVAVRGLQHLGTKAQQTVPALVLSLGDPSSGVRVAATNALKQIDPEAAAKTGVVSP